MSPFELALGIEAKQRTDLAIPKTRSILLRRQQGGQKDGQKCEERKACAIKFLEKV
jgi:hypothetical protein